MSVGWLSANCPHLGAGREETVIGTLISDVLLGMLDPRIRYQRM